MLNAEHRHYTNCKIGEHNMIGLILAIIFSAMIPVLLKYAHKRDLADEVILTFNYSSPGYPNSARFPCSAD